MRAARARRSTAILVAATLSTVLPALACGDDPQPLKGSALSVSDASANVGARLVTTLRDRYPTAPTGAFVDLAVTTLGAALHDDYDRARAVVADLVRDGVACLDARHADCRAEAAGVSFDFSTGTHEIRLEPIDGYSSEPRLLAVEGPGGIAVRDADAFGFVLDEERSSLRSASAYGDAPGAPPAAKP